MMPGAVYASVRSAPVRVSSQSSGRTTILIGRSYLRAKTKSRVSCAGTPMTMPVPYVANT